ncbi:hypothetical protein RJ55_05098 [Drechmeria coniospora]|nr:hypothetical protein RJ55_05098 [Drechmeria coniospora]
MPPTQPPPLDTEDGGLRTSHTPSPTLGLLANTFAPKLPSTVYADADADDGRRHAAPSTWPESEYQPASSTPRDASPSSLLSPSPSPSISPPPPPPEAAPVHPIPLLQDAFRESLDEATEGTDVEKPRLQDLDAESRWEALLAQDKDASPFGSTWRYRPGQQQHELLKLLAQISFGVYLLINGMASSNDQVFSILQSHIDEVDQFLEVALQDLDQTVYDLSVRAEHLELPLSNGQAFEELLEDRNFRCEILDGNEKIDHVVARTNAALKQWDEDIEMGLRSAAAFTSWLDDESAASPRPDLADVFDAMKGNAKGWLETFDDMNERSQEVINLNIHLTTIVAEMEKKAGEVSRRTWVSLAGRVPCRTVRHAQEADRPPQSSIPPFTIPLNLARGSQDSGHPRSTASGSSSQSGGRDAARQSFSVYSPSGTRPGTMYTVNGDNMEFPVPGGLPPVLPLALVNNPGGPKSSARSPEAMPAVGDANYVADRLSATSGEPLYVLQPHTYTPRHPEPPALSPMLEEPPMVLPSHDMRPYTSASGGMTESSWDDRERGDGSLRKRATLRKNIPDSIRIPPRATNDTIMHGAVHAQHATPRTTSSQAFDAAYGSDADFGPRRQPSKANSSSSQRSQALPSPRSDHHQYYQPVHASPYSPLQQRPHTAAGPRPPQFRSAYSYNHPQPQGDPGRAGGVSSATYDSHSVPMSARSQSGDGDGRGKKKKGAFGWIKKAFSLDEDEKAAFEARKTMVQQDAYYEANTPKFLDGKRIRG